MELEIASQALCLLWGLLFGLALGLFYELLRLCRKKWAKTALFDGFFAVSCFVTAFLYGMHWASGRLGLWEMGALATGFSLYISAFSPIIWKTFRRLKIFQNF